MKTASIIVMGVASSLFAGCASTPTALSPVGSNPASRVAVAPETANGILQVYSATEKSPPVASDDHNYYAFNLHSGYDIHDAASQSVKFVANHASDMDESPDQVALPAGEYNLVTQSTWGGQVRVPVVIQKGKTTIVHLDGNWWPPSGATKDQLVFLPNGEAVGWRGSSLN